MYFRTNTVHNTVKQGGLYTVRPSIVKVIACCKIIEKNHQSPQNCDARIVKYVHGLARSLDINIRVMQLVKCTKHFQAHFIRSKVGCYFSLSQVSIALAHYRMTPYALRQS